ncbi:MAG: TIGR00282 family metallophosphoesterase [Thermodesulfobacteriota bacterium]
MNFRVLFLGDVVGKPGRRIVRQRVPLLRSELKADIIIANAENASGGIGLTAKNARELLDSGIDLLTSGNHIWKHRDIGQYMDKNPDRIVRPLNYPPGAPGYGMARIERPNVPVLYVINLLGRTFMDDVDCPFLTADKVLKSLPPQSSVLIDFHAEATSEKKALAYYFLGKAGAVLGTHTHVQTNDARIIGKKTGFITDAGMCGPYDSVLGMEPREVVHKFTTARPARFKTASGPAELNAVVIDFDSDSGTCLNIFTWKENELEEANNV